MKHKLFSTLLSLAIVAALSGCMSTKAKIEAVKTVADLKSTLEKHDQAQQAAIEGLVRQTMESQRTYLRAKWSARREELKVEAYAKAEIRLEELRTELVTEVNKALDPVETRLKNEIEAESSRGAAGSDRAVTLRLQLASTLALVQRETAKEDNRITQKMRQTRDDLLKQLDEEFKTMPAGLAEPVSDAELEAILGDLRRALTEYREGVGKTTDSLTSFLTAEQPWQLFLKGLVGDRLYQMVGPKLSEKFNAVSANVESALSTKAKGFLDGVIAKYTAVKREK